MADERTYLLLAHDDAVYPIEKYNNNDSMSTFIQRHRFALIIGLSLIVLTGISAIWLMGQGMPSLPVEKTNALPMAGDFLVRRIASVPQKRLIYSNIMFRHGDRAPNEKAYPEDEHSESDWPNGYGELTPLGYQQGEELGRYIRNRYAYEYKLISKDYDPDEVTVVFFGQHIQVRITTSGEDRCIKTAQAFISTLYPDTAQRRTRANRKTSTVPIKFSKKRMNPMVEAERYFCPAYWSEVQQSEAIQNAAINAKYKHLFHFLEVHTGLSQLSAINVFRLAIFIHDELQHNLTQPAWTGQFIPELNQTVQSALMEIARQIQDQIYDTPKKAKYLSGLALGTWIRNFQAAIPGGHIKPDPLKLDIYAVHQGAIKSMLHALNSGNTQLIPSTACLMLELYQISYRNDTAKPPVLLPLPGCYPTCTMETFANLYRNMTYDNERTLEHDCGVSPAAPPPVMAAIRSINNAVLADYYRR